LNYMKEKLKEEDICSIKKLVNDIKMLEHWHLHGLPQKSEQLNTQENPKGAGCEGGCCASYWLFDFQCLLPFFSHNI
jgi:hypothetical protein